MWVCSILRFCISTAEAASGFYLGLEVELPWWFGTVLMIPQHVLWA